MNKKAVLHAHSLKKIMRYMKDEMQIQIPSSVSNAMKIIDGFYFTTRYPGNDSFIAGEEEIADALEESIETVHALIVELQKEN